MNMRYNYPTTMYEIILAKMYVFLVLFTFLFFYHENFQAKVEIIFFYQKYVHLGENTFIHCSRITVVYVHVNVFL